MYRSSNYDASGIPKGFHYDAGTGRQNTEFPYPILFDINFNQSKAYQFVTLITQGLYIDDYTQLLSMILCSYNPEAALFAWTNLTWSPKVRLRPHAHARSVIRLFAPLRRSAVLGISIWRRT